MDSSPTRQLLARLAPADCYAAMRFMYAGVIGDDPAVQWQLPLVEPNAERVAQAMRDWSAGMVRRLAWDLDERGAQVSVQALAPLVRQRVERLVSGADGSRPFGRVLASSCEPDHVWMTEIGLWTSANPPRLDEVDWEALTAALMALPSRRPCIAPLITGRRVAA